MEALKLEVGKTYISRKGKEVKIVEKDNQCENPYQGSNDECYAESGRWRYDSKEDPEDLVEEIPTKATRYTFAVPDGVKEVSVEQEGNRIVVEMVPEEVVPKPGDVMINDNGSVYIFKEVRGNGIFHNVFAWLGKSGRLLMEGWCPPGRPATPEEAQPLWDALRKAGKRWNPETMRVEEIPERERIMAFLQSYAIDTTWTHEQLCWLIEGYLKHREGEK